MSDEERLEAAGPPGALRPAGPEAMTASPAAAEPSSVFLTDEDAVEEAAPDEPEVTLADVSQEVRRLGRELFKVNRASERNQELFETALEALGTLTVEVGRLPDQSAEIAFTAKAALCRDLLEVVDALGAGVAAGQEVMAQLQEVAEQPLQGIVLRFGSARQLFEGFLTAVGSMSQWHEGQQLVYQRLLGALHAAGARPVEAEGRPFDPSAHHAVSVEPRPDLAPGTILREERKGYRLDGKILRYSEVVVVKNE